MDKGRLTAKAINSGFVSPFGDNSKAALIDRIKAEFNFYFKFSWGNEERQKNDLVAEIINMPQLVHANVQVFVAAYYTYREKGVTSEVDDETVKTLNDRLRVGGPPKNGLEEEETLEALKINVIRYIYALSFYLNSEEYNRASNEDIQDWEEQDLGQMDVERDDAPEDDYGEE